MKEVCELCKGMGKLGLQQECCHYCDGVGLISKEKSHYNKESKKKNKEIKIKDVREMMLEVLLQIHNCEDDF